MESWNELRAKYPSQFSEDTSQPELVVTPYVPEPRQWVNKTSKGFTGGIASGRGRRVTADDQGYAIEANPPLTAPEIALAQRNGFDAVDGETGHLMLADKAEVRRVDGDINHDARVVTGGQGRGR